jgi:hypothetical protein
VGLEAPGEAIRDSPAGSPESRNSMKATCPNCNTTFHGVERDEDGRPEIENTRCAHPRCEVYLCEAGCQHLSFSCEGCDQRFCNEHKVKLDGLPFCLPCAIECLEANLPECLCVPSGRALFDPKDCPIHNSASEWNARSREITAVQQLEELGVA